MDVASTQTLLWLFTGPDSALTLKSVYLAAGVPFYIPPLMSAPAGSIKGPLVPQEETFALDLRVL